MFIFFIFLRERTDFGLQTELQMRQQCWRWLCVSASTGLLVNSTTIWSFTGNPGPEANPC